ncbi:MAG: class I SAM-dependent methyltransferase [Flammeovirgaceae bacterium]|nr:class I SAM-dependent methyltransferase [Flammeovirgaceae bacterium]
MKSYSSGNKILDVGCGTGDFLQTCMQSNFQVSGVEVSAGARMIAERKTGKNIVRQLRDINETSFDLITLWHVLEHVPDLNQTLVTLKEKLSDNGRLFIAVPNYASYDCQVYSKFWAGYDVPRHLWHFDQNTMKALLTKNTLILEKTIGMKLDAFYISMLSEKYKRGQLSVGGLISAVFNGLISNLKAMSTGNYSSLIYIVKK